MAKASDVVGKAVRELQGKLKEIKDADEDDLAKVASAFDAIAERADEVANVLNKADSALAGKDEGDDGEQDDDEEEAEQKAPPKK